MINNEIDLDDFIEKELNLISLSDNDLNDESNDYDNYLDNYKNNYLQVDILVDSLIDIKLLEDFTIGSIVADNIKILDNNILNNEYNNNNKQFITNYFSSNINSNINSRDNSVDTDGNTVINDLIDGLISAIEFKHSIDKESKVLNDFNHSNISCDIIIDDKVVELIDDIDDNTEYFKEIEDNFNNNNINISTLFTIDHRYDVNTNDFHNNIDSYIDLDNYIDSNINESIDMKLSNIYNIESNMYDTSDPKTTDESPNNFCEHMKTIANNQSMITNRLDKINKQIESKRLETLSAILIQKYYRRYQCRYLLDQLKQAFKLQLEKLDKAIKIQSCIRRYHSKLLLDEKKKLVNNKINKLITIQCLYRKHRDRKIYRRIIRELSNMLIEDKRSKGLSTSLLINSPSNLNDYNYQSIVQQLTHLTNEMISINSYTYTNINTTNSSTNHPLFNTITFTDDPSIYSIDKIDDKRRASLLISSLDNWINRKINTRRYIDPMNSYINLSTTYPSINLITNNSDNKMREDLGLSTNPLDVIELKLTVEGLTTDSFLSIYTNLLKLNLNVNKLVSVVDVCRLTNLIDLSLNDNKLSDITNMKHLTQLKYLSLDYNNISTISSIKYLTNLISLSINHNNISYIDSTSLPNTLQRLELSNNHLTSDNISKSFQSLFYLTYLDLSNNRLNKFINEYIHQSIYLSTLILSYNHLTSLPNDLQLPMLRNLWITNNQINSCNNLSTSCLISLEKIYLQDNKINELNNEFFQLLPKLNELDVSFNCISNIESLDSLRYAKMLKKLSIQDNPIVSNKSTSSEIYRRLIRSCINLTTLSNNPISYYGNNNIVSHINSKVNKYESHLLDLLDHIITNQNIVKSKENFYKRQLQRELTNESTLTGLITSSNRLHSFIRLDIENSYWNKIYYDLLYNQIQSLISNQLTNHINNYTCKDSEHDDWIYNYELNIKTSIGCNNRIYASIVKIQRCYRSYYKRMKFIKAMKSIRYIDDELDNILNDMNPNDLSGLIDDYDDKDIMSKSFVYGDHRRPKNNPRTLSFIIDNKDELADNRIDSNHRPSSSSSSVISALSTLSLQSSTPINDDKQVENEIIYNNIVNKHRDNHNDDDISISNHSIQSKYAQQIANEWGITNPKVIATMIKRNKRIKSFEQAKEHREKDKDSTHRYQRFIKTVNRGSLQYGTTGSFGGKPHNIRRTNLRLNPNAPMPAWAMSEEDAKSINES